MADVGIVKGAAVPPVSTSMTVGYGTTTAVLVREVGNKIFYLDPSAAPFTLLTTRAGSRGTANPKFEWYEKSQRPKTTTSTLATTNGTTLTATGSDNVIKPRDVIQNTTSGEVVLVTSQDTATQYQIVRNLQGTSGGYTTTSGDTWLVIGSAFAEGADVGLPDEWKETHVFNLTQIFRTPFGATRTREASETYFGSTRPRLRAESAIMHALDIERAFLFGVRSDGTSAGTLGGYRTTNGFTSFATQNVLAVGGAAISEPDLENWLEDVMQHTASGDSRVLFCSPQVISAFDQMAAERIRLVPSDTTYGIAVKQFLTAHGTLNLVKHRLLVAPNLYSAGALAVDPKMLTQRTLSGGATKLLMDRQGNGVDGWIDEYLTETGLQLTNPEVHGTITGVAAVA